MSDSEGSSHASDGDLAPEETLVHGRAKRTTAGNRLSYLLQHLEDEDVRNDLLAEDETDQLDYEASDDGGDVALESSDESDDEGPPKEGDQEELHGEKELQKEERVEARKKKRKAQDFANIPLARKKIKLAEDTPTKPVDGPSTASRPRKKSERLSWLPTAEDAPTRQSMRGQTVANREVTEAKLVESQKRSEKAHGLLKIAAERKAARAGPVLTQADRMAKALKVEKENARSLNRWEKSEEERQLAQRRKLEALRNRKLEGPVIRYWSGSVIWEGDKIKVKRVHEPKIEIIEEPSKKSSDSEIKAGTPAEQPPSRITTQENSPDRDSNGADRPGMPIVIDSKPIDDAAAEDESTTPITTGSEKPAQPAPTLANSSISGDAMEVDPPGQGNTMVPQSNNEETPGPSGSAAPEDLPSIVSEGRESENQLDLMEGAAQSVAQKDEADESTPKAPEPASFLDGIHYWASQSPADKGTLKSQDSIINSEPNTTLLAEATAGTPPIPQEEIVHNTTTQTISGPISTPSDETALPDQSFPMRPIQTQVPGPMTTEQVASTAPSEPTAPTTPAVPLIREQALRTLTMLESFPSLENPVTAPKKATSASNAVSSILLPDAFPTLTPAESKYLVSKSQKKKDDNKLPPPPPKATCVISSKPARFRDPKTGMAYRDIGAYKALQGVIAGRTAWSGLLGAWSGVVGDGPMGRVAKGVPDCFWTGKLEKAVKVEEGQTSVQPQNISSTS